MTEKTTSIQTADGQMTTYTFRPAGDTRLPIVIFYMDGVGIREVLFQMARRIADAGYVVALPDLFYRSGPYEPISGQHAFTDPDVRARIMGMIKEVTPSRVMADTSALIDWLSKETSSDTAMICTVGYCMGGGPALAAAGVFPDRIVAAASYHGGHLVRDTADSPHVLASKANGVLYIGYAENDHGFTDTQRETLDAALTRAGVEHRLELYHAGHGFAVPDLPTYDPTAEARHWDTLFDLFARATGR